MKTYVWTLINRIFHWLLAIGFVLAYILGDFDEFHSLHFAFGAFVGTLLFFRILFGFFGPAYAHFRDFPINLKNQIAFFKNFKKEDATYVGHNPAAAAVMLAIFIMGFMTAFIGFMLYNARFQGYFNVSINPRTLKELHEIFANVFLVLVLVHLLGILVDFLFRKKEQTLVSMVTGFKKVKGNNASLNKVQQVFSTIWVLAAILVFVLAYNFPLQKKQSSNVKTEQHE